MDAAVEVSHISKSFGEAQAVQDLSFTVPRGMIYGLLGPNGAGKTTTIRMLMDIIGPDSGTVSLFGQPFRREALGRVGYLPEERGLYRKMKVRDVLVFLGLIRGLERPAAERAVDSWMQRLDMSDWAGKKIEELSKGMQQKVQFAGTLLHDPELIILDEPFSGLDPVNTAMLKDVMLDLEREGKTIIFSTHRMDTVEKLCDAICLVNKGHSVLQGNLREIKRGFGSNTILAGVEGDWSFLEGFPGVASVLSTGNFIQIKLQTGADPQGVLAALVARLKVTHFELTDPSLEDIFIMAVGKVEA
jgi:ABC-2 type transport system ATP-binding protein